MGAVNELARTAAGALLLLARQQSGFSQRELASRAGVSQSEVARIESGKREPSIPTLQRILAGAGMELRFRLAPIDDHDRVLIARRDRRTPELREAHETRHAENVAAFTADGAAR